MQPVCLLQFHPVQTLWAKTLSLALVSVVEIVPRPSLTLFKAVRGKLLMFCSVLLLPAQVNLINLNMHTASQPAYQQFWPTQPDLRPATNTPFPRLALIDCCASSFVIRFAILLQNVSIYNV